MSAQTLDKISGLVAVNSLIAMIGSRLAALVAGAVAGGLFVSMFTLTRLFHFQINREPESEGEAMTVQTYGKRSRQSARLIWKWN